MMLDRFLSLRFALRGVNLEKTMNALRKEGLTIRRVRRMEDRAIRCVCKKRDVPLLMSVCDRFSCRVEKLPAPRLSRIVLSLLRSKGFMIGMALFLVLISLSMQRIWAIRIIDAGAYTGDVRAFLSEQSIESGVLKSDVSPAHIQQALEWRYPKVAWVKVEYQGVFLCITFVEGVPTPDVEPWGNTGDVVAMQDGLVESIVTLAGTPLVSPGDFVHEGQVLIKGSERLGDEETIAVKARGQVTARVWVQAQVEMSALETLSTPTGRKATRRILCTPFLSLSRNDAPNYLNYDKSVRYDILGGAWAPIYLLQETYEEIMPETTVRNDADVQREIALAAEKLLKTKVQTGDVVVDKWVDYSMIDVEKWAAVAVAEVRRNIGVFCADAVPGTPVASQ